MRLRSKYFPARLRLAFGIVVGALAVAAVIAGPGRTHAQEEGEPGDQPAAARPTASLQLVKNVYTLPAVYVREVNISGNRAGQPLTIEALVENRDDQSLHGDLRLQVLLLSPKPEIIPGEILRDSPAQHDRVVFPERFALLPGARATKILTYTPPAVLPTGDYRIRVQAITTDSRRLGWRDVPLSLEGTAGPFAFLGARAIRVPAGNDIGPAEGPNLAAGDAITLRADALGAGTIAFTATPHLEVYDFNLTGKQVGAADGAPVRVTPGAVAALEFPFSVATAPGAYHGVLTLRNEQNQIVSGQAEFRWVVLGPSATVVSARFSRYATRAGEQAEITADLVGPADRVSRLSGTARIELLDGTTAKGSEAAPVRLGATVTTVSARFWLRENLGQPGFRITILDDAGNVVKAYEQIPPLSPSDAERAKALTKPRRLAPRLGAGLVVLLALVGLAALALRRRRASPPGGATPRTIMTMLLLGGILAAGAALASEHASGIAVRQETVQGEEAAPVVTLFINDPLHDVNGQYEAGTDPKYNRDDVPLEFYATFVACDNHPTGSEYRAYIDTDGQKRTTVTLPNAEEKAGPYRDQNYTQSSRGCIYQSCASGSFCPQTTPTYSTTLTGLPEKPDNTVQLQGSWYMEYPFNNCNAFDEPIGGREWRNVWINHSDPPEGAVESLSCQSASGWAADIDAPSCDPANASTDPGCLLTQLSLDHPQDPKLPSLAGVTIRGKSYRIPAPSVTARGNSVEFRWGKQNSQSVLLGIRDYPTTSFDEFELAMPFSRDAATGQNNVLKFLFQARIGPPPFFNVDWIKVKPLTPEARTNASGRKIQLESGTFKRDTTILSGGKIDWEKICDGNGEVTHTAEDLTAGNTALCLRFASPADTWFDLPDVTTEYGTVFRAVRASRSSSSVPAKFGDSDHGFLATLKPSVIAALYDGLPHKLFTHARDPLGRPRPQLAGSTGPLTCTCDPPTITSLQKISPAGNPIPGDTVVVEGVADDPQDDIMTYRFTLDTRPAGSTATWEESDTTTYEITDMADRAAKRASFVPDRVGTYRVKFEAINACPTGSTDEETLDIIVVEALPDLVTRDLSTSPQNAQPGDTVTLAGKVANTGRAAADASTTVFRVDGADVGIQATGALAVNAEEAESLGWVATAGTHTFELCADRDTGVRESNEGNNCSSITVTVGSGGGGGPAPPPPPFPGFRERQP